MSGEMCDAPQPLGEVVEILSGFPFKSEAFSADPHEGTPLIRIRDIRTHAPSCSYIGDYDPAYLVGNGDIVIGMDGEFAAVRWKGVAALLNQRVLKIKSARPDLLDDSYLFHRIQSDLAHLETVISGTTVKHLSAKDIRRLAWRLPPLDEQKRIAEVLQAADAVVDVGQQTFDRLIVLRAQARASLLNFPKTHWPRRRVGEIASLSGGTTPSKSNEAYWVDAVVPWATPSDITALPEGENRLSATKNRISQLALKECSVKVCPPGTVLMTSRATIGYAVISDVSMTTNQGFLNFSCSPACDPEFLCHWLNANRGPLAAAAGGSTFKELSRATAKLLPIALPPVTEQRQIADTLGAIDASLLSAGRAIEKARAVRASLGDDLLSGRVKVPA